MQKNVTGQKWYVFAFDKTTNAAKTGDLLNITANLRIDGGAANAIDDVNPSELETGYYYFDITQAESNGDYILICPVSVTANIQVVGVPGALYTTAANYNAVDIAATGEIGLDFSNLKQASADTTLSYITINVALATTLAVRTSDTVFTMNAGVGNNDAYNYMTLALYDVSGGFWESRRIIGYAGVTKTITVNTAFSFVVAANDIIKIFLNAYSPTAAAGGGATAAEMWQYDVSAFSTTGQAGTYQISGGSRYS